MEFQAGAVVMMTWQISGSLHETLYMTKQKKKQMVSLGEGGRKLTWGFVDANSVKRQILKDTEDLQPDSAGTEGNASGEKDPTAAYAVRHLKSRILYPEAFQGVDIRYTIGPESLKEDLVLKQADAVSAFTWRYAPGGFCRTKKERSAWQTVHKKATRKLLIPVAIFPAMCYTDGVQTTKERK